MPEKDRADFVDAFAAWKKTWFSGGLAISSDPHTRAVGKEYDALIALGPAILPLVVEQLADPENFLVLQLYDALQPSEKLLVQFEPDDERILEGEQGRAKSRRQGMVCEFISRHRRQVRTYFPPGRPESCDAAKDGDGGTSQVRHFVRRTR